MDDISSPSNSSNVKKKRKKTRRGKRRKSKDISIYYCNVNGFKGKQDSIQNIVETLQPKIIAFCETKVAAGYNIKSVLPQYEIISKPTKCGQKGLAIGVKLDTFNSILDVTSSATPDIMTVRIRMTQCNIRLILAYAPQETESVETREEFYTELEIEISKCKMAEDLPFVIGDLNAKITEDGNEIKATTPNGNLLLQVVKEHELDILNFDERCVGKWTHVTRTTGQSSVLDYALTCKEITPIIKDMIIDEQCVFCPFKIKKKKGLEEPQYSDHNAIVVQLEMEHEGKHKPTNSNSWRITEDGLEKFIECTSTDFDCSPVGVNAKECYSDLERKLNRTMTQCFKMKRSRRKQMVVRKEHYNTYKQINQFARKGKAQRRVARLYIKEILLINTEKVATLHKERIKYTLENLTIDNTFSPDRFWKLCKRTRTKCETGMSVETEEGCELYGDEAVRNAYMNEFMYRLRKREISKDLQNYEDQTELLCKLYLERAPEMKGPPYTKAELDKVRKNLKKGKSPGRDKFPPDIFKVGGDKFQHCVLDTLNRVKEDNSIPDQWTQVQVSTMYKNKGKRKRLINQRGIFLKQVLSKIYGKLNINRAESSIEKIDPFQAGGKHNRSPADQKFLLRAAIDHSKYLNLPIYITLYDYSQCFDSLWLSDCLLSLWKLGVDDEVVRILHKLNQTCNIIVKTPVGMTDEFTMHSIVQQGSVSGGTLCVASIAEVTQEDLGQGCQIGTLNIKALAFVDDMLSANRNPYNSYVSHKNVKWFSDKKRLQLNGPKCVHMGINAKKTDVIPRLKIGDTVMENVDCATYIGDQFNKAGTNKDLIEERVKKGKSCLVNAMSLCAEITMGLFTIQTLLLLYKSMFLQVILNDAQAWTNLTDKNIQDLQTIQLRYLKRMMHTPQSTPNSFTFLETGCLPIQYEIHVKQFTFLHHILTLDYDDPVRRTYYEQLKYPFEANWGNRMSELRALYGVLETDDEIIGLEKESWKRRIKTRVHIHALLELRKSALCQKWSTNISLPSKLARQEYLCKLPSKNARIIFQVRAGTVNLKCYRKYMYGDDKTCRLCNGDEESVEHVVNKCPLIPRQYQVHDVYNTDHVELLEISKRIIVFNEQLEEMDDSAG